MLRYRQYKYSYYAGGYGPQLFHMVVDPHECRDLIHDPDCQSVQEIMDRELRKIADPEALGV